MRKNTPTLIDPIIAFRPKQDSVEAHFTQMVPPQVKFTFVASNGNSSLFVSEEGDLYYSK